MIRQTLTAIAVSLVWISASHANHNKPKSPDNPPAGYEHDKWKTMPTDVVRSYGGFTVSIDGKDDNDGDGERDLWRVPHWVSMHIKKTDEECIDTGKRPNHWFADSDLLASGLAAGHDSYTFSRDFRDLHPNWYDRGHLAMKLLIERVGKEAAWNTHTTLNAVPQRSKFNRGIWLDLEYITGAWAQVYNDVWVITGPIFLDDFPHAWIGDEGERKVAVPEALFKIVIRGPTDSPEVLAFIYPQLGPGYFGKKENYRHERFFAARINPDT